MAALLFCCCCHALCVCVVVVVAVVVLVVVAVVVLVVVVVVRSYVYLTYVVYGGVYGQVFWSETRPLRRESRGGDRYRQAWAAISPAPGPPWQQKAWGGRAWHSGGSDLRVTTLSGAQAVSVSLIPCSWSMAPCSPMPLRVTSTDPGFFSHTTPVLAARQRRHGPVCPRLRPRAACSHRQLVGACSFGLSLSRDATRGASL
jgi:hypothetical protein